jgi:hypothetical protein
MHRVHQHLGQQLTIIFWQSKSYLQDFLIALQVPSLSRSDLLDFGLCILELLGIWCLEFGISLSSTHPHAPITNHSAAILTAKPFVT